MMLQKYKYSQYYILIIMQLCKKNHDVTPPDSVSVLTVQAAAVDNDGLCEYRSRGIHVVCD